MFSVLHKPGVGWRQLEHEVDSVPVREDGKEFIHSIQAYAPGIYEASDH